MSVLFQTDEPFHEGDLWLSLNLAIIISFYEKIDRLIGKNWFFEKLLT